MAEFTDPINSTTITVWRKTAKNSCRAVDEIVADGSNGEEEVPRLVFVYKR